MLLVLGEASLVLLPLRVSIDVSGANGQVRMDGGQHGVSMPDLAEGAHILLEQTRRCFPTSSVIRPRATIAIPTSSELCRVRRGTA